MRKNFCKFHAIVVAILLTISLVSGCSKDTKESSADLDNEVSTQADKESNNQSDEMDPWELARTSTYEPYPETLEFTMGITVKADVAYPEGGEWSAENSAYTRFLKSKLNIQNKSAFEAANEEDYDQKVSLAIASGDIPDIMSVRYEDFKELVKNDMIEDLTESYNNCASDLMKEIYATNDNRALDMCTVDGKLYALPIVSISSGPEMLWLRGDWMDKLGLSEPETLEDIANIVREFIEKDPGGNGPGKTVGIPLCIWGDNYLYGSYFSAYRVNNLFTSFGAFPEQWIEGKDGVAVYGSVQPEMKQGLQVLADWYKKGLIDQQFAVRSYDDIKALIADGKCGSYFCGWWAPYDLAATYELNPNVEWRAYILPTGSDGKVTMWAGNPVQVRGFTVVRKGFEHPELIVKARSVTLDYNQGDAALTDTSDECKEYLDWVSHSYGVEVIGGFDFYNAVERAYQHINEALNGTRNPNEMNAYEHLLYDSCKRYQDAVNAGKKPEKNDWLNYNCRMVASKLINDTKVNTVQPVFFSQTESMPMMWESLKKMERETMLKIITNEVGIDQFDTFVNNWMNAGGEIITREVNEEIK